MHDSGHINNIFQSIISNDLSDIKAIIKSGININHKHPQIQLTPLIQAINLRRIEMIKILLETGADPNLSQDVYAIPLGLATSLGNIEIIEFFVKFLVETECVYINAKNYDKETALDKAKYWGYREIVDYLSSWAE